MLVIPRNILEYTADYSAPFGLPPFSNGPPEYADSLENIQSASFLCDIERPSARLKALDGFLLRDLPCATRLLRSNPSPTCVIRPCGFGQSVLLMHVISCEAAIKPCPYQTRTEPWTPCHLAVALLPLSRGTAFTLMDGLRIACHWRFRQGLEGLGQLRRRRIQQFLEAERLLQSVVPVNVSGRYGFSRASISGITVLVTVRASQSVKHQITRVQNPLKGLYFP